MFDQYFHGAGYSRENIFQIIITVVIYSERKYYKIAEFFGFNY